MASAAKVVTFEGFKSPKTSFCVALCGIPACLIRQPKSFCVTGAIDLRRFQKISSILRRGRKTLETSTVILRDRGSTLEVTLRVAIANRTGRAASVVTLVTTCKLSRTCGTEYNLAWQAQHLVQWHLHL